MNIMGGLIWPHWLVPKSTRGNLAVHRRNELNNSSKCSQKGCQKAKGKKKAHIHTPELLSLSSVTVVEGSCMDSRYPIDKLKQ